jgi:hypothetical protein
MAPLYNICNIYKSSPPGITLITSSNQNPHADRSHDGTASQFLENLGQELLGHLFNLVVAVVVLLLVLAAAVLLATVLLTTILLSSVLLSTVLLTTMLLISTAGIPTTTVALRRRRHVPDVSALQIHIHAALIRLCLVLQSQLATHLFHARLDLLHMIRAMISLADNNMQVRLPTLPRALDALLEHVLSLLDVQAVQVDGVAGDAVGAVVCAENKVTRLVVLLHLGRVLLAFFRQRVGARPVAGLVGLVRFVEARAALAGFLTRKVTEPVVFGFCVGGGVVEGWKVGLVGCARGCGNARCDLVGDVQREPSENISMADIVQRCQKE